VAYGVPFHEAVELLGALPSVPGRMQKIGERPLVVVDYAHTPDALEKVLQALRPVAEARGGRLAAVFGAGGDRDVAKRPRMGAIAARLADHVIVTSDNPRSEDPLAIIAAVSAGIAEIHETEPDRARAIEKAVSEAAPADVVLIAGKGHENYQEIAGKRLPFSDAAGAAEQVTAAPRSPACRPTRAACSVATCSSRCAASASMAMLSSTMRRALEPQARWSIAATPAKRRFP